MITNLQCYKVFALKCTFSYACKLGFSLFTNFVSKGRILSFAFSINANPLNLCLVRSAYPDFFVFFRMAFFAFVCVFFFVSVFFFFGSSASSRPSF